MRALFLHFKKNWFSYGFDTIVVTVGILGAFALNNWNNNRIANKLEYFNVIKNIEIKNSISTFSSKSTRYYVDEQEAIDLAKSQREMFMKYNSFSYGVDWLKDKSHSIHPSNHLDWLRDRMHQNIVVGRILVISNYCLPELNKIKNENQQILDLVTMELKRFE